MLLDQPAIQVPGDRLRKWLFDDQIQLIIWFDSPQDVHGFQILYDLPDFPQALTIFKTRSFTHQIVDSGENGDLLAKGTPILTSIPAQDLHRPVTLFLERSSSLPEEILSFIVPRLKAALKLAEQGAAANP